MTSKDHPKPSRTDLASDIMGKNSLQGDDQSRVRNQRQAVPDVKQEADDNLIETFEKTDKKVRAKRDLGQGRRSGNSSPDSNEGKNPTDD